MDVIRFVKNLFVSLDESWFNRLPEAELFPDDESRRDAIKSITARCTATRWFLVNAIIIGMVCLGLALGVSWVLETIAGGRALWITITSWSIAIIVIWAALAHYIQGEVRKDIRRQLNELGIRVCLKCGYRVVTETDRCSECGRKMPESSADTQP